jgi:hypothetical protein
MGDAAAGGGRGRGHHDTRGQQAKVIDPAHMGGPGLGARSVVRPAAHQAAAAVGSPAPAVATHPNGGRLPRSQTIQRSTREPTALTAPPSRLQPPPLAAHRVSQAVCRPAALCGGQASTSCWGVRLSEALPTCHVHVISWWWAQFLGGVVGACVDTTNHQPYGNTAEARYAWTASYLTAPTNHVC